MLLRGIKVQDIVTKATGGQQGPQCLVLSTEVLFHSLSPSISLSRSLRISCDFAFKFGDVVTPSLPTFALVFTDPLKVLILG
ncbi:hypothetical protein GB937_008958 [Aspergillus fischeri]|nr:hypothetical protein GB937_008958 [Aspergillus fischeri]